ncbi:DNA-directed RNA polymerase subunit alpha [candidate division WWE3 bacterium]|nr:DNA-directed RNA polymerase subunit alpha [candidate division WWE3 bacterium]
MIKPVDLKINTVKESETEAVYTFEPLPKGYGHTMGSVLRRVLLTSVEGAAVTQFTVKGVKHQFSTIEGVKEDVVEITLNLKNLRFKKFNENAVVATLSADKKGVITAGDLDHPSDIEVVNPEAPIATITKDGTKLEMELIIESGYGYSPSEDRETDKIGEILLDALFTPVLEVSYEVTPTRFGKKVDLDELTLKIKTDGSVEPKEALLGSSRLVKAFFEKLILWEDAEDVTEEELEEVEAPEDLKKTSTSVADLPLPTRTVNALQKAGVKNLSDLAGKSEEELMDIKNVGKKSLEEIIKLLKEEDLA